MACLNKSNSDNFLTFHKVSGSLTLSQLQATGLPSQCDNTKVNAATNLAATTISDTQINLSWDDNTAGSGTYTIYRGTTSGDLSQIDTGVSGSSYNDTTATDSDEFFYHVIATAGGINSDASNEASAWTWGVIEFDTDWNDATASDGEFTIPRTSNAGSGYDNSWLVDDVEVATTEDLTIAADSGTLDGTTKRVKLISSGLRDTNYLRIDSKELNALVNLNGLNGATLTQGFNMGGSGGSPDNDITSLTWPESVTINATEGSGTRSFSQVSALDSSLPSIDHSSILLESIPGVDIRNAGISTYIQPKVGSSWSGSSGLSGERFYFNQVAITSFDFSNIEMKRGYLLIYSNTSLTSMTFQSSPLVSTQGLDVLEAYGNSSVGYHNGHEAIDWGDGTFGRYYVFNCNWSVAIVNQVLVECAERVAANGTTSGTIRIEGTNAAPDGSSGGYDGTQAVTDMTTAGLTVTTS